MTLPSLVWRKTTNCCVESKVVWKVFFHHHTLEMMFCCPSELQILSQDSQVTIEIQRKHYNIFKVAQNGINYLEGMCYEKD